MKKLITILLLQSSLSIIAMEQSAVMPPAVASETPERIVREAWQRIILEGPDAQLYKTNSFLWAYMHPEKMEFNKSGIKFLHYEHSFISYIQRWQDVHSALNILKEESKQADDEGIITMHKLIESGPHHRITLSEMLAIQKVLLKKFEEDKTSCYDAACKTNRAQYRVAFNDGAWQQLPALVANPFYCKSHTDKLSLSETIEELKIISSCAILMQCAVEERRAQQAQTLAAVVRVFAASNAGSAPQATQNSDRGWNCLMM